MVSDQCDFSGNNTVYFYPDCRTALVGTFGVNGQLKTGHVTEIVGVDRDAAHNPEPVFLAPDTDVRIYVLEVFSLISTQLVEVIFEGEFLIFGLRLKSILHGER